VSKIINNIIDVLEARQITQKELSSRLGWHQPQLHGYLSGKVQIPIGKLEAILDELGLNHVAEKEATESLRLACIASIFEIDVKHLTRVRDMLKKIAAEEVDPSANFKQNSSS